MSLEARIEKLEEQHRQADANMHSLAKVCADIKNIALTNQHDIAELKTDVAKLKADVAELKADVAGLKTDVTGLTACVQALAEATHAGFIRTDEQHNALVKEFHEFKQETREKFDKLETRFDQLELLIRQSRPSN